MSLRDVINEIADDMEDVATDPAESIDGRTLKLFATQLRRALKASEGEEVFSQRPALAKLKEQARLDAHEGKIKAKHEEAEGSRMVWTVDGPHEGMAVPLANAAPEGCYVNVLGHRYQFIKGELRYTPEGKE